MYILLLSLGQIIAAAIFVFAVFSIVMFIKDGKAAKKEERSRNKKYTVMFIISMALIALMIVIGVLLSILAVLVVKSM